MCNLFNVSVCIVDKFQSLFEISSLSIRLEVYSVENVENAK